MDPLARKDSLTVKKPLLRGVTLRSRDRAEVALHGGERFQLLHGGFEGVAAAAAEPEGGCRD
jgi:hypothetical protein